MKKFKILVKTGNQEKAGTDANVWVMLEDENSTRTAPLKLDNLFYDDLERGVLDWYTQPIPAEFGKVKRLHVKRDRQGPGDDWFCDYIIVQDPRGLRDSSSKFRGISKFRCPGIVMENNDGFSVETYFPICRWITADHTYSFKEYGVSLPNEDIMTNLRLRDLEAKRDSYKFVINMEYGPVQVSCIVFE